ncbi:hypothetical protein [Nonomuraea turcica]|uniref:hypothetical protein n=1 Tax=Nonomuraea sp. G32 TaxID=3067274 RepID=UPI00273B9C00|nr:hypothetical protein [Nonomuraea sp. G32]MDP4511835.1 hypothetical protein [Nonomuraea sp. G32]
MKQFLSSISRRERLFAAAGTIIALVLLLPVVAVADPGLVPGTGPGAGASSTSEQPVDVQRGDSCRNMLPADTPNYVVCRWLTPPQDAAQVAEFWGADNGANLERAQPLPAQFIRCNRKTDLTKISTCKGGETFCQQLPNASGWYRCTNRVTRKVTYEGYVNGKWVARSVPPPATWPSRTPTPTPTMVTAPPPSIPTQGPTVSASATPVGTTDQTEPPPDGNPSTSATTPAATSSAVPTVSSEPTATTPTGEPTAAPAADDSPAGQAIAAAAAVQPRLRIWVETDLADDYAAGDSQFTAALQALIAAAKRPGVVGVKFADNLGYSGFTTAQDVIRFLTRAGQALRAALPGKQLAIGVVVAELGCGSSKECIQAMRAKAPLATKQQIGRYLKTRAVDRVEISSGLFGRSYSQYQVPDPKTGKSVPITPELAARAQWMSIRALEWDTLAQMRAREYGLAHIGDTSPWDKTQATVQIDARVGAAIALGLPSITLWGHKSDDQGQTYRLLDAGCQDSGPASNAMWSALTGQGMRGRLALVFDPASTECGIAADIAALAKGVSEIFILV